MKKPYKVKIYPSGLRLIVQHMKGYKSVSMGVNVHTGSCNEKKGQEGISHFVEHMLFKGTKSRPRDVLMKMLDGLGILANAWTSETDTQFLCTTIRDNIQTGFDVLSDMYFNLQFSEKDLEIEREVILQEIAMYEDNPADVAIEAMNGAFFAGTCFEHPIIGSKETVKKISKVDIENYIKQNYIAKKTIVSVAGDLSFSQAEKLATKYFENIFAGKSTPEVAKITDVQIRPKKQYVKKIKEIEQHTVNVAFPFINLFNPKNYEGKLFSVLFGNGFTSRLFTEVREKQGLVYGIGSSTFVTKEGGLFYIAFSCTPKNTEQVLKTIKAEIDKVIKDGITEDELKMAKNMIKTTLLWKDESVNYARSDNATVLANKNEVLTTKQRLLQYSKVTIADVNKIVSEIFNYNNVIISLVGPKTNIKPLDILK